MSVTGRIGAVGVSQWMTLDDTSDITDAIRERATVDALQRAISHVGDVTVVSCTLNDTGEKFAELPKFAAPSAVTAITVPMVGGLPPYWDVEIDLRSVGGLVARINVWLPVTWNGRFIGALGGGNRTTNGIALPEQFRNLSLPVAVRNGFACADTDGANRDPRPIEWGLNLETGQIDWDLTENWVHRSTHEMTIVGKAVTEAIYGKPPVFSYTAGCSGGGRQALTEAQRYPDDYHGIWSSDPAINWNRFIPAELWPTILMKETGVVLAPAKLDAFRTAAIAASDERDGLKDGIIGFYDPELFDAHSIVGQDTEAGPITTADADVMHRIWEGPRARDGRFLWYGIRPGTESWGDNFASTGLCRTEIVDGERRPIPFEIAEGFVRAWIKKDANWRWQDMSLDDYEHAFVHSEEKLATLGCDDPDLATFRDRGGKLILSHGAADQVIPADGSLDYYKRVVEQIGSLEATRDFIRLFISDGDGHGVGLNPGPGLTLAEGMSALMKWVEHGEAPQHIVAHTLDKALKPAASRPVYAYPQATRYSGSGDLSTAANFESFNIEHTQPVSNSSASYPAAAR